MPLEAIETASRDEIAALQLERLQKSLRHAYANVAHTKAKFDAAGVHPDDLKSLNDLTRFPFTTKADLRETYPFGMFAVPMDDVVRVHASSGTTGKPTVVGYTQNDIDTWAGIVARSIRAAGGTKKDIIHVTHGYGLFTGGLGVHYGAERVGCTVVPISGGQTERQVQLIQDFKPTMIVGTPSYVLTIVDEFERQGLDPAQSSLQRGMFGAEPWGEEMRRELETRLGIAAMDLYGLSEVIGPGVACECLESRDGPTIWEDHFYPEIIDPATRQGAARWRAGRTGIHLADQGSAAHRPLPHARPDATAAADGPQLPPHRQDHRPLRRHADHPRRQPLSLADRGIHPEDAQAFAALTCSRSRAAATWTTWR